MKLFATSFGWPLPTAEKHQVRLEACDLNCGSFIMNGPLIGQPALDLKDEAKYLESDGTVTFLLEAKDPKNNRTYIDGQLNFFRYSFDDEKLTDCLQMCNADPFKLRNSLIAIRVFDGYTIDDEPIWLDHVYPIFKQYANMFPVMTENFVELGNYHEVIYYRHRIQICLELSESQPNYMPVTRDLSKTKKDVILRWLRQRHPQVGNPGSLYTVDQLREDLQIALQLEHSTLPQYMTAWASIKQSYNQQIKRILREIIIQEMIHICLLANILNAVEETPLTISRILSLITHLNFLVGYILT